eukprot:CAMPEP_0179116314 /NCGR_PEP_ID=MMETSP0796-20121207/54547_1 /TAXON_ID=73915 /ORGANISM="Pyrodinium bahamense, Strain pbaha01" /LENGTH=162 /DNA_ID=CAMNT_0020814583 /DNA_START=75 /DNA_END=560 /DNA_ORIENTATION=-
MPDPLSAFNHWEVVAVGLPTLSQKTHPVELGRLKADVRNHPALTVTEFHHFWRIPSECSAYLEIAGIEVFTRVARSPAQLVVTGKQLNVLAGSAKKTVPFTVPEMSASCPRLHQLFFRDQHFARKQPFSVNLGYAGGAPDAHHWMFLASGAHQHHLDDRAQK